MSFGPAEAFTPEQLAELYDVNVLSTQSRQPRGAAATGKQGRGLLVGVSSSSVAGARRRICRPISPPRPAWMRWRLSMLAS
jgi:hypothetical protein